MKIDYDGDVRNQCPLCGEEMPEYTKEGRALDICEKCEKDISEHLDWIRVYIGDDRNVLNVIERWIENRDWEGMK